MPVSVASWLDIAVVASSLGFLVGLSSTSKSSLGIACALALRVLAIVEIAGVVVLTTMQ